MIGIVLLIKVSSTVSNWSGEVMGWPDSESYGKIEKCDRKLLVLSNHWLKRFATLTS